jgi:hypothetical protein
VCCVCVCVCVCVCASVYGCGCATRLKVPVLMCLSMCVGVTQGLGADLPAPTLGLMRTLEQYGVEARILSDCNSVSPAHHTHLPNPLFVA